MYGVILDDIIKEPEVAKIVRQKGKDKLKR